MTLVASAGDRVGIGRRDEEWPGWIWCTHERTGRSGWIAESLLEPTCDRRVAILARDYNARELTVAAGQIVAGDETIAGWTWCRADRGDEGWVPTDKLIGADWDGHPRS